MLTLSLKKCCDLCICSLIGHYNVPGNWRTLLNNQISGMSECVNEVLHIMDESMGYD